MHVHPIRRRAAGAAFAAVAAVGLLPVATAQAAPAHAAPAHAAHAQRACPTAHTLYDGLHPRDRRAVHRSHEHHYGIYGIRCTAHWSAAVIDFGSRHNGFEATLVERRTHAHWHEVSRAKPCARHEVPRKIYAYACDSN